MASLTVTAYYTRRAINWAILALIAYIILRFLWSIFFFIWLSVFPPKPPPPNHAFGKLPAIKFPPVATPQSSGLIFRLETIEGSVPKASESATVYFMPKNPPNFLGIPRTQEFAKRLGFHPNPITESTHIYRFNDSDTSLRRLRYDFVTDNFILRYDFEHDLGLFNDTDLPLPDEAISQSRNLLQTYDLYHEDVAMGIIKTSLLELAGTSLVPTENISQADAIRVDFFRKPIGNTALLTPSPNEAPISFIFSNSKIDKKRILQFAYTYWPIDSKTTATYPLKPSLQAWQELQNGQGYIARLPKSDNTVVIRNVYLAYYDSLDPQTYLQPIFVFEGDEGFIGYVPAVTQEWIE